MNQNNQIQGGNRNQSVFSLPFDQLDFDFLGHYESGPNLEEGEPFRMRLDSEYVWEGEEMMYEDIVASTQPLNYNMHTMRKHADNYQFYHPYNQAEQNEDMEITQQIEFRPYQGQEGQQCHNSCGRNQEAEEEFGLDSTIISNLEFNSSMAQLNHEFNFDMLDMEQQETSFLYNSICGPQMYERSAFENPFLIQMGQQSPQDQQESIDKQTSDLPQSKDSFVKPKSIKRHLKENLSENHEEFKGSEPPPNYRTLGYDLSNGGGNQFSRSHASSFTSGKIMTRSKAINKN